MNIHHASGGVKVLELRVRERYGARWNMAEGTGASAGTAGAADADEVSWKFRGFLVPHSGEMADLKKSRK